MAARGVVRIGAREALIVDGLRSLLSERARGNTHHCVGKTQEPPNPPGGVAATCRPVGECGPGSPSAPPLPFFRGRAAPPWILGRGGSLCQRSPLACCAGPASKPTEGELRGSQDDLLTRASYRPWPNR